MPDGGALDPGAWPELAGNLALHREEQSGPRTVRPKDSRGKRQALGKGMVNKMHGIAGRDGEERAGSADRVVVVGAGFAGLEVAKELGKAGIPVVLVDRQNHHLFQPLLYQVATAALSAAEIAEPIRKILRRYPSVEVLLDEVVAISPRTHEVTLATGRRLGYRFLVLATGARTTYFGHGEWSELAPGLKTIEDARQLRSRLLLTFEHAERVEDPLERSRLMTIAVIGGGPTGVELAGSIAELSRFTLARDFRTIRPQNTRVLLVEGLPRLLAGFSDKAARFARERLERLGVEIRTGSMVDHIGPGELGIAGERLPVGLVIWAAGVGASTLGAETGGRTDKTGRVFVEPTLEVTGSPGIFALGDVAHCRDADGQPLPGLAQVARQQGLHLGRGLAAMIKEGKALEPFVYRSRGNTAIVGRHAGVFERGRLRMNGWLAWLAWAAIHVYLLVGFQHRLLVSFHWLWRYITYERGARLITFRDDTRQPPPAHDAANDRERGAAT